MSIKVMTLVWDRFPAAGSELLAMLALADWCTDDGGSLYPSIATLAAKIRVSESQARRILHGLIDNGYVTVIGNANGGAPGTTRQYRVIVAKLRSLPDRTAETCETASTHATPSIDARGSADARDGSHGCAETGSTHDTQTINITISKPSVKTKGAGAPFVPPDWIDATSWNAFVAMRKKIRKPMTDHAVGLMLEKLEKLHALGHDVKAILDKSTLNCWQDVYEPKAADANRTATRSSGRPLNRQEALEARNREVAARLSAKFQAQHGEAHQ
jgi:hypothetical protein